MSIPPPKIDKRSYAQLVKQTQQLVQEYTQHEFNKPDAGLGLIRIFSQMAGLVSDRINRMGDRNLIAFLNLIGTQQTPPQPARVPLTFNLASGSPVDALVPARTQISAPAAEGDKEEVIFETEQDVLVSSTQLQAIFVIEDRDYYNDYCDRIDPAIASQREAFLAFKGHLPVEHYLYLSCDEVFKLPELTTVVVTIDTLSPENATQLKELLHIWYYWDNKNWQPLTQIQAQEQAHQLIVTLTELPKLMPVEVNGQKGQWLRVSLKPYKRQSSPEITQINISSSINKTQIPKICLFGSSTLDLTKDFYPFGALPLPNETFLIALDDRLIQPGVSIQINTTLSHSPRYSEDLEILWEVGNGEQWYPVEKTTSKNKFRWNRNASAVQFAENSTSATFQFPQSFPDFTLPEASSLPGDNIYWLRARILKGFYGTKGRERKYVSYNDVTLLSRDAAIGQSEIYVDNIDELEVNDIIRIQSFGAEIQQEEVKIAGKVAADKKLTLEQGIRNTYFAGSRILTKFVTIENTPDVFDPPVLQAISITYKFGIDKNAFYYAYNDFTYCEGTPVAVRLSQTAHQGETIIKLGDVSQFVIGELIKFADLNPDLHQIELIDRDRNSLVLTHPLNHDHLRATKVLRCFHTLTPQINSNSALYLGFNKAFPNRPNTLYLQVEPPHQDEVAPTASRGSSDMNLQRIAWEYASPQGWQPLVVQDETQAFAEKGIVQFIGPTDAIKTPYFAKDLYWLRARKKPTDWDSIPFAKIYFFKWALEFRQMNLYTFMRHIALEIGYSVDFPVPPRLSSVRTNTIWASQSITQSQEILGSSNNDPKQIFTTILAPILSGQKLDIQEGRIPSEDERKIIDLYSEATGITTLEDETGRLIEVWVRWQEVPDFYSSGPKDRHYVLDRQLGRIYFGNGQAGMIPPRGRNNIRLTHYQTGGGLRGNREPESIVELKTTIPYIDSAINWEAATGGNDQESIDRLKERSPQRLRHRDRAVTAQDFEDLVYESSLDIARVQIITPEMWFPDYNPLLEELWIEPNSTSGANESYPFAENQIQVFHHEIRGGRVLAIIVPHSTHEQPTPNLALIDRVEQYITSRCVPTLKLRVTGPKWQEIRVITEIVPVAVDSADAVRVAVGDRIHNFLHPLTGGSQGRGWSFGRQPHISDLYAVIEAVPGVDYVRSLDIQPTDAVIDIQTLIYSGQHLVTLKLPGEVD